MLQDEQMSSLTNTTMHSEKQSTYFNILHSIYFFQFAKYKKLKGNEARVVF